MITKNFTLDSHHRRKIAEFNKKINTLKQMQQNLQKKCENCNKLENVELTNKMKNITNDILAVKHDEMRYYLKVMDLLIKYYNTSYIPVDSDTQHNDFSDTEQCDNLNCFIKKEKKIDKARILNEYMFRLYNNTKHKKLCYDRSQNYCKQCHIKKNLDVFRSIYICPKCGTCEFAFIETGKIPFINEPVIEGNNFSYRRYDHFVEWLNKFQNNKKLKIPKKVYQKILSEIRKMGNQDLSKINKETLSAILKKTGYSKYNNQIYHIINKLNNKPIPKLPRCIQEKMKIMFKQTQQPFENVCPSDRTNFLSYSYVIRKFLEILNQYKYVEYFPLLKSREKLYCQDLIWKSMCNQLNWKYNPSI